MRTLTSTMRGWEALQLKQATMLSTAVVTAWGQALHAQWHTCRVLSSSATHSSEVAEAAVQPHSVSASPPSPQADEPRSDLTPREVVERLDRNIIGQADAKKAVANALRNRWRRQKLGSPMKEEIVPKNILMIGPTGCGKTEIARRLAKLMDAPFVKVEATKFTEVGFHGRDVDQIIRDLLDAAMVLTRAKLQRQAVAEISKAVEDKILAALLGPSCATPTVESFRQLYREGALENHKVTIEVPPKAGGMHVPRDPSMQVQQMVFSLKDVLGQQGGKLEKREMTIAEARPVLEDTESQRLISDDTVRREAIEATEQDGIVFIDEIDKIVSSRDRYGADASSEGVQRDLLPIIEGSTVSTRYGNVNTDHILFICSGAFHAVKPADMLAELQGRLPVRVELKGLTQKDFYHILTEPENNMIKQQQALMSTEGVDLRFTDDAVMEIARLAEEINTAVDNIGARRLHTVLERILEPISFDAPEKAREAKESGLEDKHLFEVDKAYVQERLGELVKRQDLSKYVL